MLLHKIYPICVCVFWLLSFRKHFLNTTCIILVNSTNPFFFLKDIVSPWLHLSQLEWFCPDLSLAFLLVDVLFHARLWPVMEPFEVFCPLEIYLRINFYHSFFSTSYIFISCPVFTVEHRLDCHASGVLAVPNTLLDTFSCHLILRRTCQQWNLSGSWVWCSWLI